MENTPESMRIRAAEKSLVIPMCVMSRWSVTTTAVSIETRGSAKGINYVPPVAH